MKLDLLRKLMVENNIDAYLVIDSDNHSSEYVNKYYKERSFISSFTGSNGIALVTKYKGFLYTDGRYFLQAEDELNPNEFELVKCIDSMTTMIIDTIKNNNLKNVGLNGERFSSSFVEAIKEVCSVNASLDLIKDVWTEREELVVNDIYSIDNLGLESHLSKINRCREYLGSKSLVLTDLTDIAWLFNLRGSDVLSAMVFLGFAYIDNNSCHLFVNKDVTLEGVIVHKYDEFQEFLKELSGKEILIDKRSTNYLYLEIISKNNKVVDGYTPTTIFKAIKSEREIELTKDIHIADGYAVFKLMKYVKENKCKDELDAVDRVLEYRKADKRFITESFDTIAGFNSNGAIVHYEPTKETNKVIDSEGLLLVDSGGQYMGGTTDITRTFSIGKATDEERMYNTLVLKGHIDIAKLVFDYNTQGKDIDLVCRAEYFKRGLDYKHGTGHGVGFMNSVHEGPNRISYYGAVQNEHTVIKLGNITSNEPGIYLENKFGIRIESEVLCVKHNDKLAFETITYCPIDLDLVEKSMLDNSEIEWLNNYHEMVFNKISPLCNKDELEYLKEVTRRI